MNHLNQQRRGFAKGAVKTYACRCCGRVTRPTGTGDNDGVQLCVECYDLAGEENAMTDTGEFYGTRSEIRANIEAIAAKGGNASVWDHLKAMVEES